MAETSWTYLGFRSCGCAYAACVDDPKHKKDTSKFIAKLIRDGLTVTRVETDVARHSLGKCVCTDPTCKLFNHKQKKLTNSAARGDER